MKLNKYHILLGIIVVVVLAIAAFLGIILGNIGISRNYKTIAEGIIIEKKDEDYTSVLITNYDDYIKFLKKYNINERVFLTAGDLEKNDYIIDFILYDENLKIENIDLEIADMGINLTYFVNKNVTNSNKILIYFIPLSDKGLITNYNLNNHNFEVKWPFTFFYAMV